jgi:hypothetical protein
MLKPGTPKEYAPRRRQWITDGHVFRWRTMFCIVVLVYLIDTFAFQADAAAKAEAVRLAARLLLLDIRWWGIGTIALAGYAIYSMAMTRSRDIGFYGTMRREPLAAKDIPDQSRQRAVRNQSGHAPPDRHSSLIEFAAYAPPQAMAGEEFYIQLFLHELSNEKLVEELAAENEPTTKEQGSIPITIPLQSGDHVRVCLDGDGAVVIGNSVQQFDWNDKFEHVAFALLLPRNLQPRQLRPIVRLYVKGLPVGILRLRIDVVRRSQNIQPRSVTERCQHFKKGFISYTSKDRLEALRAAQVLKLLNIDVFADVFALRAGQNWAEGLSKAIAECDLFLLVWSTSARNSEWVLRETLLALGKQRESNCGEPAIVPLIVEGPPPVEPPPELQHIHFNDVMQTVYFAEEQSRGAGYKGGPPVNI